MEYIRDYAMYAAVFGFFSFVWFGWAQERPKPKWRLPLGIASGVSLLVCIFGVYLSVKNWHSASALNEYTSFAAYLITFYTEFVIAGVGAFVLIRKKKGQYVAPWVLFIVGIHFISLQFVFNDPALWLLAALLVAVAAVSVFLAPKLQVAPSAVAGIGAGSVLLCFALLGIVRFFMAQS